MTIFIPGAPAADLSSYSGLISSIESWLERTDIADRVPYFIQLAEARFRRLIVNPEGEAVLALVPGGSIALPSDFDSARSISLSATDGSPVWANATQVSPSVFQANQTTALVGHIPTIFTVVGNALSFNPAPTTTVPATLIYRRVIPALTLSAPSNWLLAEHPDLYLYGSLLHAEFFGWNDDRLPLIKSAVDEQIGEIQQAGNRKRYGGGPLYMRPTVTDRVGNAYR